MTTQLFTGECRFLRIIYRIVIMYQYSLYVFICIYLYLNCWGKVLKDLYLYVHINLIKMQKKKKEYFVSLRSIDSFHS